MKNKFTFLLFYFKTCKEASLYVLKSKTRERFLNHDFTPLYPMASHLHDLIYKETKDQGFIL